jgi:uracil phosphoribosyltransferase
MSKLRNEKSSTTIFREHSNRIMTLLIEEAIGQDVTKSILKYKSGAGVDFDYYQTQYDLEDCCCAVSILRAGDAMVETIMRLIPGISNSKILIQRDEKTSEP